MHTMSLRLGAALSLGFLVLFGAMPAHAGSKEGASAFISNLGKTALGSITSTSLSADQKRATLRTLFEKSVDIDWISKFVLGQYWRTATPAQKAEYQKYYKDFLVKNYTTNFQSFENTTFLVTHADNGDEAGEYVLTMTLKRPGYEDIHMVYNVREKGDGYRVYDFTVEGVSLITSQRSEFSSVISRQGMDYLIAQIKQKAEAVDATAGK